MHCFLGSFSVLAFLDFEAKKFASSGSDEGKSGLCGTYTTGVGLKGLGLRRKALTA